MCLNPVTVPNPLYGRSKYVSECGDILKIDKRFYSQDAFIEVPCNKCVECRQVYYNSILQRALIESRSSYMYFVTLTYDNAHLPVLRLPDSEDIYFADYSHIQNMFKRFRSAKVLDRDFRYLCVTEYGDTYSRPHFHLLVFVAKKSDDLFNTPYIIERLLFDNLQLYYAKNIGTRKNPQYERLFTYKLRYTSSGVKTNYFVKYVEPNNNNYDYVHSADYSDNDVFVKTIRYLIGYVNKGSSFDNTINFYLERYSNDFVFVEKLRDLLRSKIRYSKGFGCGFVNGEKFYIPKVSVASSGKTLMYSELIKDLPSTFSDFAEFYPEQVRELQEFILVNPYEKYDTLESALCHFGTTDFYNHCLILRYFPKFFNAIYYRNYAESPLDQLSIAGIFKYIHYKYAYHRAPIYTQEVIDSDVYRYLRKGVENGISSGVPFLAFEMVGCRSYTALCKFYRDRVTSVLDIQRMYDRCVFRDWTAWKNSFQKQLDYRTLNRVSGNKFTHNSDFVCKLQKKYIDLSQIYAEDDLYRFLYRD